MGESGSNIWVRRAYEPAGKTDGYRVLVDRLWPRGVSKEKADLDAWTKHLAPSDELRKWFGHEVERWEEFRTRYRAELDGATGEARTELDDLIDRSAKGRITLVFAAHDPDHNNAVALREYLTDHCR